ncbi:MAG: RluA family pseudouridine synthase [Patescibacteria group bacterium UBA2103]
MNLEIIYEDNDVVVVNKPAGILVHADGHSPEETVSDWMEKTYPESKNVGEPMTLKDGKEITRPGVVHRLDKDTSGVLILAKTDAAHAYLKEQFQNRDVQKEYAAFVYGNPKQKKGVIEAPIGRSAQNFKMWSAQRGARGNLREAITEYEVERGTDEFALLKLFPKTGRTHQLRVHMKYLNYPILCDKLYAPKRECALGFKRMALHAKKLTLILPSGETKEFEAKLPEDFETAIKTCFS